MEFLDLNEDIGAEDWLIPSEEITRRRLIKQTPRFNVYRADWFGDVLVYEPANNQSQSPQSRKITHFDAQQQQRDFFRSSKFFNQEELSSRLGELSLRKSKLHKSQITLNSNFSAELHDSAYSSISSTPQYDTKDLICGFEFPSSSQLSSSIESLSSLGDGMIRVEDSDELDSSDVIFQNSSETNKLTSPVTVLNKHSYTFGVDLKGRQTVFGDNDCNECKSERTSWNELNELRLIAHEGFMLFMGVSLDDASDSTSLVMQMNHPRAVSLYNLLHASKISSATTTTRSNNHFLHSPIERFFASKQHQQQPRPQLSIEAKLNICQQVTDAMTYLHDKNIVHGKLTSVNIYLKLNNQVKISLIDESPAAIASTTATIGGHNRNSVEFNLPALTYLSPELIKTIGIVSAKSNSDNEQQVHVRMDQSLITKKSDIFSFGTLLFELFEERFPFAEMQDHNSASARSSLFNSPRLSSTPNGGNSPPYSPFESIMSLTNWNGNIKASASEIIYQIGSGQTEVNNLNKYKNEYPALIEHIISSCWSTDPNTRPHFKQLSFA